MLVLCKNKSYLLKNLYIVYIVARNYMCATRQSKGVAIGTSLAIILDTLVTISISVILSFSTSSFFLLFSHNGHHSSHFKTIPNFIQTYPTKYLTHSQQPQKSSAFSGIDSMIKSSSKHPHHFLLVFALMAHDPRVTQ